MCFATFSVIIFPQNILHHYHSINTLNTNTMGSLISKVKSSTSSPKSEKMAPIGMTHFAKAQTTFKPPLIANENAFLGDIASRYFIHFNITS